MYVLLTNHPGNTVQYMPERRSREGMYRVRYYPRAWSITHSLHAQLGYQHFFHSFLLLLYSGSKSGPYSVILGRLSGQYREIWTGLGCRGLASCMTTVTCRVLIMYTQHVYSSNDSLSRPKFLLVRYHVQGGTRIEGGCTWRKPLMKNMCSECGYCL